MIGDPDLSIGSPADRVHREEIDRAEARLRTKMVLFKVIAALAMALALTAVMAAAGLHIFN